MASIRDGAYEQEVRYVYLDTPRTHSTIKR